MLNFLRMIFFLHTISTGAMLGATGYVNSNFCRIRNLGDSSCCKYSSIANHQPLPARNRDRPLRVSCVNMKIEPSDATEVQSSTEMATYEGTGSLVKGLVSALTDVVNAVMSRGAQVGHEVSQLSFTLVICARCDILVK